MAMRNPMRPLTLALVGLLCLSPFAFAQSALTAPLSGSGSADLDKASGSYDHAADVGGYHAAADAAAEGATGGLGADLTHSEVGGDGFWAWLSLRLDVLVEQLSDLLGQDAAVDGGADVKVGDDGLDVDATLNDVNLGEIPYADVEAKANEGVAKVHETKATVEGMVPHVG
jgi:hypothetical protein